MNHAESRLTEGVKVAVGYSARGRKDRHALPVTTTMPFEDGESYPGQSLSPSQLLYAIKSNLQDIVLGGRYAYGPITWRAIY